MNNIHPVNWIEPLTFDIAFFWVGRDVSLPACMVGSVRHFFGREILIHQMTDDETPEVSGITHCHRNSHDPQLMSARTKAMSNLGIDRPTLFLDADMLVIEKFELPDIAEEDVLTVTRTKDSFINHLYPEPYPEFVGKRFSDLMPYLGCFLATRSPTFLRNVAFRYRSLPDRLKRWYGDQIVLKAELDGGMFRSIPVPPQEYCYPARRSYTRTELKDLRKHERTKILHAKGNVDKADILSKTLAVL